MNKTIFNTPVISGFFHYYARFLMRLYGWRIKGKLPDIPKFVLIGPGTKAMLTRNPGGVN